MNQRAARTISYILRPTRYALVSFLLFTFPTHQNADLSSVTMLSFCLIVIADARVGGELRASIEAQVTARGNPGVLIAPVQIEAFHKIAGAV